MSGMQVILATSLLVGCAAASLALYFYSRRYVGQLQYLPDAVEPRLCFSVLDFWGHRQAGPLSLMDGTTTHPHAVCILMAMPSWTGPLKAQVELKSTGRDAAKVISMHLGLKPNYDALLHAGSLSYPMLTVKPCGPSDI